VLKTGSDYKAYIITRTNAWKASKGARGVES
jgi:hypothetical protein